jgi:hypothetical protein
MNGVSLHAIEFLNYHKDLRVRTSKGPTLYNELIELGKRNYVKSIIPGHDDTVVFHLTVKGMSIRMYARCLDEQKIEVYSF